MKLFLTIFSVVIFSVYASKVHILSASNFTGFVTGSPLTLVMFYAPWCSHSKNFLPALDSIADELDGVDIPVAKVDCLEEKDLYWSNNIEGFPTLKILSSDPKVDPVLFKGQRDAATVVKFAKSQITTSFVDKKLTLEGFNGLETSVVTGAKPLLVLYIPHNAVAGAETNDNLATNVVATYTDYSCKRLDLLSCAVTRDVALAEHLGIDTSADVPALVVLRHFQGEPKVVRSPPHLLDLDSVSTSTVMSWLQLASFPLFVEFHPDNESLMFADIRPGFKTHVVLVVNSEADSFAGIARSARVVAASPTYAGKMVFVYIDVSDPDVYVSNILDDIRISRAEAPTAIIIRSMKNQVQFYRLDAGTDINEDSLTHWLQEYSSQTISPTRTAEVGKN